MRENLSDDDVPLVHGKSAELNRDADLGWSGDSLYPQKVRPGVGPSRPHSCSWPRCTIRLSFEHLVHFCFSLANLFCFVVSALK